MDIVGTDIVQKLKSFGEETFGLVSTVQEDLGDHE